MLSLKAKYALKAMIALAGREAGVSVSGAEIAQETAVPRPFLEQIFNELRRGNLVVSRRGKLGGYFLARPADQISFADIIRPLDGPLALAPCASRTAFRPCEDCRDLESCRLRPALIAARDAIALVLENTSLASALKG